MARWRTRLRRRVKTPMALTAALIALVIVAAFVGEPDTMISASAHSEYAHLDVMNPQAATFALPAARRAEDDPTCLRKVLVKPAQGARVEYIRPRGGALSVEVRGGARWMADGVAETPAPTGKRLRFVVANEEACAAGDHVRLPFNGVASIGKDLKYVTDADSAPLALLSARVALYGRSVIGVDAGPLEAHVLFASQEFGVPGGSRIAAARKSRHDGDSADATDSGAGSPWYGFASVDFKTDEPKAIEIEASANARRLEIYAPAPFWKSGADHGSRPDVIALTLAARLSGDPNLLWIYGLVALIATVLGVVAPFRSEGAP